MKTSGRVPISKLARAGVIVASILVILALVFPITTGMFPDGFLSIGLRQAEANPGGWLAGWDKRIELTTDHAKIGSDLTFFPITAFLDKHGENYTAFSEVWDSGVIDTAGTSTSLARNILFDGNYMYAVSQETNLLEVYNVSNIDNPIHIKEFTMTRSGCNVLKKGNYLFVSQATAGAGVVVIDVTDPANPSEDNLINLGGSTHGLFLLGNYLYVCMHSDDQFHVIDVTDPTSPVAKDSLSGATYLNGCHDCYVEADNGNIYAYVTNYLAGSSEYGFVVVNVTDETDITVVGYTAENTQLSGITKSGDYCFCGTHNPDTGLFVFDVSTPSAPSLESTSFEDRGIQFAYWMDWYGEHLVSINRYNSDLTLVDVSNVTAPEILAEIVTNTAGVSALPTCVAVSGDRIFVSGNDVISTTRYWHIRSYQLINIESDTDGIFDEVGSNYLKIAVADDAESPSEYYVEVETWNSTSKEGVIHFGKSGDVLPSESDETFYLYYDNDHADNTSYVGVPGSTPAKAVWDSYFKAVYHENSATDTTTELDSTSNVNSATKKANNEPTAAIGKIGMGKYFDGADYMSVPLLTVADEETIEFWIKSEQTDVAMLMETDHATSERLLVYLNNDAGGYDDIEVYYTDTTGSTNRMAGYKDVGYNDGEWHHIILTVKLSTHTIQIYKDGVSQGVTYIYTGTPSSITVVTRYFGADVAGVRRYIDAYIDELRYSSVVRSDDWKVATYYSVSDGLLVYGSEESQLPEITNTPSTNAFGILEVNTTANTAINYFQIENTGTGAVDVVIYGTDVTGGDDTWALSDTATPNENVYGLKAGLDDDDDEFDIIVRKTETYNTLVADLAEDATQDWGLKIWMPTSLSGYDNGQMSGTITLVASAAT